MCNEATWAERIAASVHVTFDYCSIGQNYNFLFRELDPGLEEPIASILWATPRLQAECQELVVVSEQLTTKYGKEFAQSCRSNQASNVNEKLMHKLSVHAPPKLLVEKYLEEIARTYNVPFVPQQSDEVLAAEGLLIDFNEKRNGPGGGGGGGGMHDSVPNPNIGFVLPPEPQVFQIVYLAM